MFMMRQQRWGNDNVHVHVYVYVCIVVSAYADADEAYAYTEVHEIWSARLSNAFGRKNLY